MSITKKDFDQAFIAWAERQLIAHIAAGISVDIDGPVKAVFLQERENIIKTAEQHQTFNRQNKVSDVLINKNRLIPVIVKK